VEDGVVYFAAGIVNYDGIHVYALDAATGEIKWQNNTSGHLDPEARTGVSVQGHMLIHDSKLYLAGGTSISPAIFDLADGECLNDPAPLKFIGSSSPRGQEFYIIGDKVVACGMPLYGHPEYPVYDPTVTNKMLHSSAGAYDMVVLDNRKIMCYNKIDENILNNAVSDPADEAFFMSQGWGRLDMDDSPLWEYDEGEIVAIARCENAIIVTRKPADRTTGGQASLAALDIRNGENLWNWQPALPSSPVSWGLAVDHGGRIFVTLKDGQVICYGERD
jgi:hypothetical protein